MRMQIRICTEADCLLAHLTVMDAEFHGKTPSLHHVKQRLKFVLTKWIVTANNPAVTVEKTKRYLRHISVHRWDSLGHQS